RAAEFAFCVSGAPQGLVSPSQVVMGIGEVRSELYGPLQGASRVLRVALIEIQLAQSFISLSVIGVDFGGAAKSLQGILDAILLQEGGTENVNGREGG